MDKKTTFREAIKIGLATVLTYYIAMRMGWMNPTWAAIAVGMISLPTAGQSISKGILRMGGTILAFFAGLFFLGLYPQSRWLFFLALTPFLAFIAYKTAGKKDQYFWFVLGFVTLMICTAGSGTSEYVFQFAMFRTLETLMGIVVWTLISVFIWPRSNLDALKKVGKNLFDTKTEFLEKIRASLLSTNFDDNSKINSLLTSIKNYEGELDQTIMGAASESYDIAHLRKVWNQFQKSTTSIYEILSKLSVTARDLESIDLETAIPNLVTFLKRIESRFEKSAQLLGGTSTKPLDEKEQTVILSIHGENIDSKDYYQSVVIASLRQELIHLDSLSAEILDYIYQLVGIEEKKMIPKLKFSDRMKTWELSRLLVLDPDRVRASIMVVISMWVGAFIWIYVNPPGHITWFQFLPNLTLMVAMAPQVKFTLFKPMTYAYFVGLVVYVFIMPQLAMFWQLGLVIMAFTFVAAYLFTNSAMRTALYMALYNMIGIQNDQTYNFASQANSVTFTLVAILVTMGLTYIMRSPRPEKMFLSMVHRFFLSCDYLTARSNTTNTKSSLYNKMKTEYYMQELRTLPDKMALWGAQIDHENFPNNSPQQINNIASDLKMMALRIEDLCDARQMTQSQVLLDVLQVDFLDWYQIVQDGFMQWSEPLKTIPAEQIKNLIKKYADHFADKAKDLLNQENKRVINPTESENFYRLVGSLGGLSSIVIAFSTTFGTTDWEEWKTEVFS